MKYIASIVEGHGEVECLPALLHRIAVNESYEGTLIVNPPIRIKSGSFFSDPSYREKQLTLATAKVGERDGLVLVLLDCEDGCPAQIGPQLLNDAIRIRANANVMIALAYREYETWFLYAIESLRGLRGISMGTTPPPQPESIRGAKEWLGARMDGSYDPITHQIEFTRCISLDSARASRSFDRLYLRILAFLLS